MTDGIVVADFRSVAHGRQDGQFAVGTRRRIASLEELDPVYRALLDRPITVTLGLTGPDGRPSWTRQTRNWTPVAVVTLNPERDSVIETALSRSRLSSSIGEPAFLSRPGNAHATARSGGEGRSGATRSHAQRALAREHGEDGEHRTFSAVSTVAHSAPVGEPIRAAAQTPKGAIA